MGIKSLTKTWAQGPQLADKPNGESPLKAWSRTDPSHWPDKYKPDGGLKVTSDVMIVSDKLVSRPHTSALNTHQPSSTDLTRHHQSMQRVKNRVQGLADSLDTLSQRGRRSNRSRNAGPEFISLHGERRGYDPAGGNQTKDGEELFGCNYTRGTAHQGDHSTTAGANLGAVERPDVSPTIFLAPGT